MEYFSSCSVLSDYAKSEHFVPKGEPEIRFKEVGGIPVMCNTTVLHCLESNEIPLENKKELEIQSYLDGVR